MQNIQDKKEYKLFSLYTKKNKRFVGGTLFHLEPDRISIALRVIERAVNQEYKKRTTVDFWFESQFVSRLTKYNVPFLYHGMDTYPRRDHEIGLALFKLQVGAYPIISSHETKTKTYTTDQLMQQKPIIFFDDPDTEGFFKSVHLWYKPDQLSEEIVKSFKVVFSWAGIKFVANR